MKAYKFNPETAVYYPQPPDTARIQFLTSIKTSRSIEKQRSGFGRFFLGELPVKLIRKPYGIVSSKDKIYICDTEIAGLEIIDLKKKSFEYFIPKGKGILPKPLNCCVDDDGNLYVADGERRQVVIFNDEGLFLKSIQGGEGYKPTDVAVNDSLIFTVDLINKKIVVFSKDTYELLYSFPDSEKENEDYLFSPVNMSLHDSLIYVSDIGDAKVKTYSLEGMYRASFGSYGTNFGQFVRLKGIAVDSSLNVYAVDAATDYVQIFNNKGQLLMYFGGTYEGPGGLWLPAKVAIDYVNTDYFSGLVDPEFTLEYVLYVTSQYGPDKINVYGFIKPKEINIK